MEKEVRRCSHCGKKMNEGWKWGDEFYCSDECLNVCYSKYEQEHDLYPAMGEEESSADYTKVELDAMFMEQDECYWTQWESVYID